MSETSFDVAMVALRAAVGLVFLAHGIKHWKNREKTIRWTASIGFLQPRVQWFFMTFAEIGIGVALVTGFLTSIAAAGLIAVLAVAFWTVHRHAGFFITARPDEGYEYVLVLVVTAVAVAMLGPGRWSLDHAVGLDVVLDGGVGALLAAGGVGAAFVQLLAFYRPGQLSRGSSG